MQNIIIAFSTYHRKMLSLLLVLVLLDLTQLSEEADIVFRNTGHDEGDACSLDNGLYGQCRRHSQCIAYSELKNQCGFIGSEPVLCCDVLQEQCNAIRLARTGKPPVVDHIIGETEIVEIAEFPFMALLMYSNPEFRCGASLVSDRFLLTAAHCIRNREQMVPESVMLGTIEADDPGATIIRINRTFVHENYKAKTKQNDIAIIRLDKPIIRSSLIKPICLHTNQDYLPETEELTIVGWGVQNDQRDLSNLLLKGTVRPILIAACRKRFGQAPNGGAVQLTVNHLCALGNETQNSIATDACQGDSGGPLVLTQNEIHYLTGITSTGGGCGSVYFAGVYTRVSMYLQWIISKGVFEKS